MPLGRQKMIVLIVTRNGTAVEYAREQFIIKFSDYGITVTPKAEAKCGWANRVYPWSNIGIVEERKA